MNHVQLSDTLDTGEEDSWALVAKAINWTPRSGSNILIFLERAIEQITLKGRKEAKYPFCYLETPQRVMTHSLT